MARDRTKPVSECTSSTRGLLVLAPSQARPSLFSEDLALRLTRAVGAWVVVPHVPLCPQWEEAMSAFRPHPRL